MSRPGREEIDEQIRRAREQIDAGRTTVRGMSYEEGVVAGIEWVLGEIDDKPMEDTPDGEAARH